MNIGDFELDNGKVYMIAEISGNHLMNKKLACELIVQSSIAGANAVKFQTYTAGELAAPGIMIPRGIDAKHDAWLGSRQTLQDVLLDGGVPREWHKELKSLASEMNIEFLSTPFSVDGAKFLVEEIGVKALKIASGDLTFYPLLDYANSTGLPIILSTGCAYLSEVIYSVQYHLSDAYHNDLLAILHCNSTYPCPPETINLLAIDTLKKTFPKAVIGFSDHTTNTNWVPVGAVMMGAAIYEKHVCHPNMRGGLDERHSITTLELSIMIHHMKSALKALGDGKKVPQELEKHDRLWARRNPSDWLRPTKEARDGLWS